MKSNVYFGSHLCLHFLKQPNDMKMKVQASAVGPTELGARYPTGGKVATDSAHKVELFC